MKYLIVQDMEARQTNEEPDSKMLADYDNGDLLIIAFENGQFIEPVIDSKTIEDEDEEEEPEEEFFITSWFTL